MTHERVRARALAVLSLSLSLFFFKLLFLCRARPERAFLEHISERARARRLSHTSAR